MNLKFKVIRHYLSISVAITLILFVINMILIIFWLQAGVQSLTTHYSAQTFSNELTKTNDTYKLSPSAEEILTNYCLWIMLLNDEGNVIWSENLPPEIPLSYTSSEIAGFSKWYLKDYPVRVWAHPDGLLVIGEPKNTLWKLQLEVPEPLLKNSPFWLVILLISNIIGTILLCLLLGLRFFKSLREVFNGTIDLAHKKPVHLETKGVLRELALCINTTSEELIHAQKLIEKKDTARNNWIAGVSHDIRTPLSMVIGYSNTLENNPHFSPEERKQLHIITTQGERIKNLIDDLNLTVRLEYEMQPLNIKPFYLSALIRKVIATCINSLEDERYTFDLCISDDAQTFSLNADYSLFERALFNLINNSIQHNPNGSEITVTLEIRNEHYVLEIKDIGLGFPESVVEKLNHSSEMPTGTAHGLGLFIVKQVAETSNSKIEFANWEKGSCTTISFNSLNNSNKSI